MATHEMTGMDGQRTLARFRGFRHAVPMAAALTALIAATPASAQPAGGGPKVGAHQTFGGQINGRSGVPDPVEIFMACVGPIKPAETGHPMAGQTVGMFLAEAFGGALGHTGPQTTSIGAFFGAPPPATPSTSSYVDFTRYGTKPLPTSLTLPCAGHGHVIFVPLPTVPGGRSTTVPVTFVGQP